MIGDALIDGVRTLLAGRLDETPPRYDPVRAAALELVIFHEWRSRDRDLPNTARAYDCRH